MLTVLFWNINGRNREKQCADLAHSHSVSILALAKCSRPKVVLEALNPEGRAAEYHLVPSRTQCRVRLFAKFLPSKMQTEVETTHYTIRRLVLAEGRELLLVVVHERSKLRRSETEQDGDFRELAQVIASIEDRRQHTRTLLIGDLNADPFQEGIYSADGLHGVNSRAVAQRGSRVVSGREHRFFYNPSWRFFSDSLSGPSGTYYRQKSERTCRFWHVFDQVLIKPSLLPFFSDGDATVVRGYNGTAFHRPNTIPDPDVASDHFPIVLRLNFPGV